MRRKQYLRQLDGRWSRTPSGAWHCRLRRGWRKVGVAHAGGWRNQSCLKGSHKAATEMGRCANASSVLVAARSQPCCCAPPPFQHYALLVGNKRSTWQQSGHSLEPSNGGRCRRAPGRRPRCYRHGRGRRLCCLGRRLLLLLRPQLDQLQLQRTQALQ